MMQHYAGILRVRSVTSGAQRSTLGSVSGWRLPVAHALASITNAPQRYIQQRSCRSAIITRADATNDKAAESNRRGRTATSPTGVDATVVPVPSTAEPSILRVQQSRTCIGANEAASAKSGTEEAAVPEKDSRVFSNQREAGVLTPDLAGYKVGNVVEGTVQSIQTYGAFIDIGGGVAGLLHISQISREHVINVGEVFSEGDLVKAMVLRVDLEAGHIALSTKGLESTPGDMLRDPQLVYDGCKAADVSGFAIGDIIEGTVEGTTTFGAFIDIDNGPRGLLHEKYISHHRRNMDMDKVLPKGGRVRAMVLKVDQEAGRITLSTRELESTPGDMLRDPQLVYERAEEMAHVAVAYCKDAEVVKACWQGNLAAETPGFEPGDVIEGTVQSVRPYGAFIDLGGGIVGLLHAGDISQERIIDVEKVLFQGDLVKVMVQRLSLQWGRITLSTGKLELAPGDMLRDPQLVYERAEEVAKATHKGFNKMMERARSEISAGRFKAGIHDIVEGTVQNVRPYGAFIDLGNGILGLLHISQISHERINDLCKILSKGDHIKALVLNVNLERGHITLSTKKLEPTHGDMLRDPQFVYEKAEETAKEMAEAQSK